MKRIQIEPSANTQLESIFAYSVNRWGYDRAAGYSDELSASIDAIAADTSLWRRVPASFGVEGYVRKCGSHLIYWRCGDDDVVRIVAVLHERMQQSLRLRDALDGEP